jgi:thiol-disulfide isomerase/thioredoxin
MKTRWKVAAAVPLTLAGGVLALLAINGPPDVPAIATAEAATTTKPFVVKAHARWCHICLTTNAAWEEVERAYAGRVNFVVFDLTTDATFEAGRAEARRLGLEKFFDDNVYGSGMVFVLDGRSKEVTHSIDGSRDFAEYRAAIDDVLAKAPMP